ncbi:hypothetical protein OK016_19650 [Vibrio chagasii]|nr:hypothetical protein [Vibrio chagasii]
MLLAYCSVVQFSCFQAVKCFDYAYLASAELISVFGKGYIKLLQMIVIPLVFVAMISYDHER